MDRLGQQLGIAFPRWEADRRVCKEGKGWEEKGGPLQLLPPPSFFPS